MGPTESLSRKSRARPAETKFQRTKGERKCLDRHTDKKLIDSIQIFLVKREDKVIERERLVQTDKKGRQEQKDRQKIDRRQIEQNVGQIAKKRQIDKESLHKEREESVVQNIRTKLDRQLRGRQER